MAVVLLIVALICFVLAAFAVTFAHVLLVPLGLAFLAASFLVGPLQARLG
jgi:hypothetical protein